MPEIRGYEFLTFIIRGKIQTPFLELSITFFATVEVYEAMSAPELEDPTTNTVLSAMKVNKLIK